MANDDEVIEVEDKEEPRKSHVGKGQKISKHVPFLNFPAIQTFLNSFPEHYDIWVGDLSPEIEDQTLRDAFAPFGEIS